MTGSTERLQTTSANFENRTAHDLRSQLDADGHGGDFDQAYRDWSDVAHDFERIGEYLDTAIKKAAAAHTGAAADASQAAVTPLAEFTRQAKEQALAIGNTVSVQGLSHKTVRWDAPENPAAGPPDKQGLEHVLPSSWTGHSDRVDVYEEENRAARAAMNAYQNESNERLQSIPVFDPPPSAEYRVGGKDIIHPIGQGDPALRPGGGAEGSGPGGGGFTPPPSGFSPDGGSGGGSGGPGGGYSPPGSAIPPGSVPPGASPAPAPGIGADSHSPGGNPNPNPNIPGGGGSSMPGGPGAGQGPGGGFYPGGPGGPGGPGPGRPGFGPGGGAGGPGGGRPGFGLGGAPGGPGGGRMPGGLGGALGGGPGGPGGGGRMAGGFGPGGGGFGPGSGGPGAGFGPGGSTGAGAPGGGRPGGFGPAGGGAGAAGGGMAGGGGAGGRGGDGDEDKEHKRASYLLEDDDIFGDGRKVAPPVFGA